MVAKGAGGTSFWIWLTWGVVDLTSLEAKRDNRELHQLMQIFPGTDIALLSKALEKAKQGDAKDLVLVASNYVLEGFGAVGV